MGEFSHKSVLLYECIENLNIKPNGIYMDLTAGGGGHSFEIAKRLTTGKLICIDRDQDAIDACTKRLEIFKDKVIIRKSNFSDFDNVLKELDIDKVDGALLDLGVSSYQIDTKERGFSFMQDGRLDMRMDQSAYLDAYKVVNTFSQKELTEIFFKYGEENNSKKIAAEIVKRRELKPVETTAELSQIIKDCAYKKDIHKNPSTRVFQALRIYVNNELSEVESIEKIFQYLNENARLCVISFHSLEDRIVKNIFKKAQDPCICPKNFPKCVCGKESLGQVITKKAITPCEEEVKSNPRSRSAKLRVFEKGK